MREVVAAPNDDTDQALASRRVALRARATAFIPRVLIVRRELVGAIVEGTVPRMCISSAQQ
jgi:hypothetical protein